MGRKLIISSTAVLLIIFVTFRASQSLLGNAARSQDRKIETDKTVYVETIPLKRVVSPVVFQRNGTLRSGRTAELSSQVNERIIRISKNALNGKVVKKGEMLLKLDSKPLRIQKEKISIKINRYKNEILKLFQRKKNIKREIELQKQIIAFHEKEINRVGSLLKKNQVSQERVDDASVQLLRARESMIQHTNNLGLLPYSINDFTESIRVARAEIDEINLKLENSVIRAPFDGRVTSVDAVEGEIARSGKILFTIYDISSVELPVSVSTKEYMKWFSGFEVRKSEERPFVRFLLNVAGAENPDERVVSVSGGLSRVEGEISGKTRTATVVFSLNVSASLKRALLPGMFIRADIVVPVKKANFRVERRYIHDDSVYVMESGSLNIVPVKVLKQPDKRDIILSGLKEGWDMITTPIAYPLQGMIIKTVQ